MTDKIRIRIAAFVTALFIAGISIAGVASHRPAVKPSPAVATATSQPGATALPVVAYGQENDHE